MTDGQKIPEEFSKKLKDRICPNWRTCKENVCGELHSSPHVYQDGCASCCVWADSPCIQIPDTRGNMIEITKIDKTRFANTEDLIAIDKGTSIDYYTYDQAKEIKRRLNELFPG